MSAHVITQGNNPNGHCIEQLIYFKRSISIQWNIFWHPKGMRHLYIYNISEPIAGVNLKYYANWNNHKGQRTVCFMCLHEMSRGRKSTETEHKSFKRVRNCKKLLITQQSRLDYFVLYHLLKTNFILEKKFPLGNCTFVPLCSEKI